MDSNIGRVKRLYKFFLLSFLVFIVNHATAKDIPTKTNLTIAAIDWCPQICIFEQRQGYVIEIVKEVFKGSNYNLKFQYYPWSRAIKNVTLGDADILLAPAKSEAPHLVYPDSPIGHQRMCFFVDKDSDWQYSNLNSLKGINIGIAIDSSIEELNDYRQKHPEQFQFQPYHERFIKQNALKIKKGRIDSFIFTLNTTNKILKDEGLSGEIKNAGCVSKTPIYMALTPIERKTKHIKQILLAYEKRITKLKQDGSIGKILESYNIQ